MKRLKGWFRRNFKRKMPIPEVLNLINRIAREHDIIIYYNFFYHRDKKIKEELIRIAKSMKQN